MSEFHTQKHPENLLGTLDERPDAQSVQKEGILYYATDIGTLYISVLVGGVMTWELTSGGAGPVEIAVALTGSDTTGDGTAVNPFLTLQHALSVAPVARGSLVIQMGAGNFGTISNTRLSAGPLLADAVALSGTYGDTPGPSTIIRGTLKTLNSFTAGPSTFSSTQDTTTIPTTLPVAATDAYRGLLLDTVPPSGVLRVVSSSAGSTLFIKSPRQTSPSAIVIAAGTPMVLQTPNTVLNLANVELSGNGSELMFDRMSLPHISVICEDDVRFSASTITGAQSSGDFLLGANANVLLVSCTVTNVGDQNLLSNATAFQFDMQMSTVACALSDCFLLISAGFYGDDHSDFLRCQLQGGCTFGEGATINITDSSFRDELYLGGPHIDARQTVLYAQFASFNGFTAKAIWASMATVNLLSCTGVGTGTAVAGTVLVDGATYIEGVFAPFPMTLSADVAQLLAVQVGSLPVSTRAAVDAGTGVVDPATLCRAALASPVP